MPRPIDFREDTADGPAPSATPESVAAAAALAGKEAAVWFPERQAAVVAALRVAAGPGQEVIAAERSYLIQRVSGRAAREAGVALRAATPDAPVLALDDMFRRLRDPRDPRLPRTGAVWLEEAAFDGAVAALELLVEASRMAHKRGARVIVDGALLLHGSAALKVAPARLAAPADLVVLSAEAEQGLQVGTCVAGGRELLARTGGLVHGAGPEPDAGLVEKAAADNALAAGLAQSLRQISGVRVDRLPEANVVLLRLPGWVGEADVLISRLAARGIWLDLPEESTYRLCVRGSADGGALSVFARELGSALSSGGRPPGVN